MPHDCPSPEFKPGDFYEGFLVKRVELISHLRITAYEMEYVPTGTEILHLHCNDRENLFAITFLTPPPDSSGLPHILEHSVLAGSQNFPVKDAFNELLKGSLQTFLNAFTYPDRTIYPVASTNKVDFYNLVRVYMDLVLRPRLLEETFWQEGYHLEPYDEPGKGRSYTISGVVYNEMKGAYSSPNNLMYKVIQEGIFPDTVYRFDAGGHPEHIPSLTYESFKKFHTAYYTPSNARIFLYGDISPKAHMEFFSGMVRRFERVQANIAVNPQPRWNSPRYLKAYFPIGRDEDPKEKSIVNCTWLLCDVTDEETVLALKVVAGCLVGTSAGPLRKALIDSRLGHDLSPATGMECDYRQPVFTVGLRGTEDNRDREIEALILETLDKVWREGLDRKIVEGILHQVEFRGREIVRAEYPYGLILMNRVLQSWIYGGDPIRSLNFAGLITRLRKRWEDNPRVFEEAIKEWLIDNPHRLLSVMVPDPDYLMRREDRDRRVIEEKISGISEKEEQEIINRAQYLKEFQSMPDPPEALRTIPRLRRLDLDRYGENIPKEVKIIEDVAVLCHDQFTNGIAYIDLVFDVGSVVEDCHVVLPFLCQLMANMGAAGLSYDEMAKRIALRTGGITCRLVSGMVRGEGNLWQKMVIRVKTLNRNIKETMEIISDVLFRGDFSDVKRAGDLLVEKRNSLYNAVVPSGHIFARRVAAESLSPAAYRDEQWYGLKQLAYLTEIIRGKKILEENYLESLARLKEHIMNRTGLTIVLTAEETGLNQLFGNVGFLIESLPKGSLMEESVRLPELPDFIGVVVPAEVAYVAKVWGAPVYGHHLCAPLMVAARYLSNGFMYKKVRVQGGAYGGLCQYDPLHGILAFLSYRDPHVKRTLDVYDEALAFIRNVLPEDDEVEKAVIGTVGALDRPLDPAGRAWVSMVRHFSAITDEYRQELREEIIRVDGKRIREAGEEFFSLSLHKGRVAVFAGEEKLLQTKEGIEDMVIRPLVEDMKIC
ncbi:MAG: insulinase family protein [Syntrophales bacterium]|nr:insulinase family protein [Syntrophales bacterium]